MNLMNAKGKGIGGNAFKCDSWRLFHRLRYHGYNQKQMEDRESTADYPFSF